jgi:hypothetical protein
MSMIDGLVICQFIGSLVAFGAICAYDYDQRDTITRAQKVKSVAYAIFLWPLCLGVMIGTACSALEDIKGSR